MDTTETTEVEEEVVDASTKDELYNKDARYTEQDIDMERANARRAREQAETVQAAYEQSQAEIESLRQQLETKQDEKDILDEMDPDLVDGNVRKNIAALAAEVKQIKAEKAQLEAKARAFEQQQQQQAEEQRKAEAREKILKPLDEEFGAQHRNKAVALAQKLVDEGKETSNDAIEAMILMRKCYKQLAEKAKPKSSVASDSGSSGVGHSEKAQKKVGSYDEVLADMRKDTSWKE